MYTRRYTLAAALLAGAAQLFITGGPAQAAPKVCKLEITGNDMMQFDKKELKVAADCAEVELTLKHVGKLPAQTMGHNWVLTLPADVNGVASSGIPAGLKSDYLQAGDKRIIAHTKVIGGGESATVKFATSALKKGSAYTYFCSFPGHSSIMKGTFTFG